jgi:hypothetical protein
MNAADTLWSLCMLKAQDLQHAPAALHCSTTWLRECSSYAATRQQAGVSGPVRVFYKLTF